MLTTRDRVREDRQLRELERLWEAPAALEPLRVRASLLDRVPFVPWWFVAGGWVTFFLVSLMLQPSPAPDMAAPLWADVASASLLLLLAGGAMLGREWARVGWTSAVAAGCIGLALAVECHASAHHLGNWWLFELGAAGVLTGAAGAGLVDRLRR
jgi:hypothetical protein